MIHNPGFLELVERAKKAITECSTKEVKTRLDVGEPFYFLDIREEHEFVKGHAKGAAHLSRGILERDIETQILNKNAEIVCPAIQYFIPEAPCGAGALLFSYFHFWGKNPKI